LTAAAPARRLLLLGALGRMGERVRAVLAEEPSLVLAAAIEAPGHPRLGEKLAGGVEVGADLGAAARSSDVAIAFASPEGSLALLRAAAPLALPCVVGTTGFSAPEREEIRSLSAGAPILVAANFSVAVNVLFHLARRAAALLGPGFDAEIVEIHHAAKLDAPSGTALRLAEAVAEGRGEALGERLVLAREGATGARPAGAIGVRALRGGDNPGEHELLFLGSGERLELAHRSATRDHFARGAVRAACWLLGRPAGLYDMEEVLGLR
jgi:4-hydroxy-tetrahydrodipicolinate reductase